MNTETTPKDGGAPVNSSRAPWALPAAALLVGLSLFALLLLPWTSVYLFPDRKTVQFGDDYYYVADHEWKQAVNDPLAELSVRESERLQWINAQTRSVTAEIFDNARDSVEVVGEWYFSFPGQIARGTLGLLSDGEARVQDLVMDRLFPVEDELSPQQQAVKQLQALSDQRAQENLFWVRNAILTRLEPYAIDNEQASDIDAAVNPIWNARALLEQAIEDDVLAEQLAIGALASAGIGGGGALLITRSAAARAATLGARGSSRLIPAACLGTGPLVLACGAGLTVATILVTEVTIMQLDRLNNREPFEAALHEFIDQQETAFYEGIRNGFIAESEAQQTVLLRQLSPLDQIRGLGG